MTQATPAQISYITALQDKKRSVLETGIMTRDQWRDHVDQPRVASTPEWKALRDAKRRGDITPEEFIAQVDALSAQAFEDAVTRRMELSAKLREAITCDPEALTKVEASATIDILKTVIF